MPHSSELRPHRAGDCIILTHQRTQQPRRWVNLITFDPYKAKYVVIER
jgi:hypothetical protein